MFFRFIDLLHFRREASEIVTRRLLEEIDSPYLKKGAGRDA